jgi:hypothetical protein
MSKKRITDHALVRWAERVEGIDTTEMRKVAAVLGRRPAADRLLIRLMEEDGHNMFAMRGRMLHPKVLAAIDCGALGVNLGCVYLPIRDGSVVTVLEHGMNGIKKKARQ